MCDVVRRFNQIPFSPHIVFDCNFCLHLSPSHPAMRRIQCNTITHTLSSIFREKSCATDYNTAACAKKLPYRFVFLAGSKLSSKTWLVERVEVFLRFVRD
jgi:hypothetical protein